MGVPLLGVAVATLWSLVRWLPTLGILLVALLLGLHYLLPFTLRAWILPRHFRISHFSLSAIHQLAYEPPQFGGQVRIEVGSVGFVRWNGSATAAKARSAAALAEKDRDGRAARKIKDGLRNAGRRAMRATDRDKDRAWFLLRCQDVKVTVSRAAFEQILRHDCHGGGGDAADNAPQTDPASRPPPPPPSRASLAAFLRSFFPRLQLQRLLVYFALQFSFTLHIEEVAKVQGVLCAGGEVVAVAPLDQASTSPSASTSAKNGAARTTDAAVEEDPDRQKDQEARGWMRLSRIKIGRRDAPGDGGEAQMKGDAAVEMMDPLVVRVAAPLVVTPISPPDAESAGSSSGTAANGPTEMDTADPAIEAGGQRWTLRRSGVRLAVEFGGEGGPTHDGEEHLAEKPSRTPRVLGGLARKGRSELERKKLAEREMQGLGEVAATVDAGVHVRVQELEAILDAVKAIAQAAKRQSEESTVPGPQGPAEGQEPERKKPSSLVFLDSVSLELPSFLLTAQYKTPHAVLSTDSGQSGPDAGFQGSPTQPSTFRPPRHRLPKEIAFALLVRGVVTQVEINRSSADVRQDHRDWIGKDRQVSWRVAAEWKEIEGRVKLDGNEEDALRSGGKALSVGASRLDVTSTWIPPFLVPHAAQSPLLPAHKMAASHHNDAVVLMEGFLGEIRGQALFETLDAAVRIFRAKSSSAQTRSEPPETKETTAESQQRRTIQGLPRLVGAAVTAGLELRIQAPQPEGQYDPATSRPASPTSSSSASSADEPVDPFVESGDPTDPFFRSWSAPDMLCLSFPTGQISFGGEYADRSVKRTEMDRRAAKRMAKQRRQSSRMSRRRSERDQDEYHESPTQTLEDEYGVPPPPPLKNDYTQRKVSPEQPSCNLLKDLDQYGVEYRAHCLLTTNTMNAYILSSRKDREHGEERYDDSSASDSDDGLPRLPSEPIRFDLLALGPLEVQSNVRVLGDDKANPMQPELDISTGRGNHSFLLETAQVDLWRPVVMGCVRDLLAVFSEKPETRSGDTSSEPSEQPAQTPQEQPPSSPQSEPIVDQLPLDQKIHVALASFDLRIAGTDPKADVHSCRGIALHSGPLVLQYVLQSQHEPMETADCAARSMLEMAEDLRLEANAILNAATPKAGERPPRIALLKAELLDVEIDPVVDARASRGRKRYPKKCGDGYGEDVDYGWEVRGRSELADIKQTRPNIIPPRFSAEDVDTEEEKRAGRGIFCLPALAVRVRLERASELDGEKSQVEGPAPLDQITIHTEARTVELRLELFSIYLCLVALSALRRLKLEKPAAGKSDGPTKPASTSDATPKRPRPRVIMHGDLRDLHVWPTLPHDTHLFMNFSRVRMQHNPTDGLAVSWDTGMLAGQSPTLPGRWEDVVQLRGGQFCLRPEPENRGYHPFVLDLECDTARLRIPFRYVFSRIIDNVASLVKATKQLIHEHVKGGQDFIIEPHAEKPKKTPQLELRVGLFAIELEDDPFETKLNIIWRAGAEEQSARLDREAAFVAKAAAVRRAEEEDTEQDGDSDRGGSDDCDEDKPKRQPKADARHSVSIEDARLGLLAYNSSSWIKRVRNASAEQARREEVLARKLYGANTRALRERSELPIDLAPVPKTAPLSRATFRGLELVVARPSCGEEGLADYLHDVGNGLPRDTVFSLIIPVHLTWKMQEARFQIRDYPLPLLHIPRGYEEEARSWVAETDLVIAEELGGPESMRRVPCPVIPQHVFVGKGQPYAIVVPRSAMATKTYMRPTIKVTSAMPVRIGWGNSMQPAIQDIAHVLETFTKAPPDPSPRVGFWDKVRLQFHWQLRFIFPGPRSNVFFHLKGSRSPYALTAFGAGFAKAWKGNIEFRLGLPNPDREFFQIISDEYVLGIPNLRDYVDAAATGDYFVDHAPDPPASDDDESGYAASTAADDQYETTIAESEEEEAEPEQGALWVKVCARCNNGVRWGMGIVLERACQDAECDSAECHGLTAFHRRCRIFDFINHWEVHTKTAAAIGPQGEIKDSFAKFRSDFVHFSLSLTSPLDLSLPNRPDAPDPEGANIDDVGSGGYNSFHFTPVALLHFRRWWKLFDGCMSLPIRQGKLFPSAQKPSPKFGRHTATIKYRFALAPLFISHTYRQNSLADWRRGQTTVLGLKGKIGRFNVDLHQRAQEMVIRRPEMKESKHVIHKAFYMAEVDLDSVDLRAIMGIFDEPEKAHFAPPAAPEEEEATPRVSFDEYLVRDNEQEWINTDDFRDSFGGWPHSSKPNIYLMPFMACPRFTYYRQKDAAPPPDEDEDASAAATPPERPKSKFGDELSHTCLMGCATDTIMVQIRQAQLRLKGLELELAESSPGPRHSEIELRIRAIRRIIARLQEVRHDTQPNVDRNTAAPTERPQVEKSSASGGTDEDLGGPSSLPHITNALFEEWGQWENRYMVHSPLIHVSNATREILLKYFYSSRERKGLAYYASASVLRFLREMAEKNEQKLRRGDSRRKSSRRDSSARPDEASKPDKNGSEAANRLLDELIDHGSEQTAANEEEEDGDGDRHRFGDHLLIDPDAAQEALPKAFDSTPHHLLMLIQPQVSLKSNVDDRSNLILTAFRAQVKLFHVTDTRITDDPVSADVLHQTFARLDGLQVFYPRTQLTSDRKRDRAFVPLETLIDLRVEPWGFDRVIPRASAALRYDKFNQLRLGSKRSLREDSVGAGPELESHFHTSTDRVSFECQKISLSANPEHFAAIFNVVTDLVLYSDPQRKYRDAQTEALVFTRDFSRVREVLKTVSSLQEQLRNHTYLEQEFQVHLDELDNEGMAELLLTRLEFLRIASELRLVVEAFTRAQDLQGKKPKTKRTGLQLEARAAELTWHMLDKEDVPFAKFSVLGAEFSCISKQDGSATNRMVVRDLRALNSSPDQIFPEIISKADAVGSEHPLAQVDIFGAAIWNSLPPVGGIGIIERFELHLHPVRVQLEHRVGKKILDYIFSERDQQRSSRDEGTRLPGDERAEDEDDDASTRSSQSRLASDSPASRSVDSLAPSASNGQLNLLSGNGGEVASSQASIRSQEERFRKALAPDTLVSDTREEGLDADEMRHRAKMNRTFVFVEISSTLLCLTYRSEKEDKSSLPNIYNVTYTTPLIRFRSKTWSYLDLLNDIKRDMIRSVWQQKGQLIGQFLSKTHRRLPMADTRSAAKQAVQASFRNRIKSMKARTGTGLVPSQEDALDAGIAPTARADDPLVRFHASDYRDLLSGEGGGKAPKDLSAVVQDAERDDVRDEDLPFDIAAVNLINPQVAFHDDEDELGSYPRAHSSAIPRQETFLPDAPVVEEPEGIEEDMANGDGPRARTQSSQSSSSYPHQSSSLPTSVTSSPRRASFGSQTSSAPQKPAAKHPRLPSEGSTRSVPSISSSTRSAGLPAAAPGHGHVARHGPSKLSDEQKARLILGRSLD